MCDLDIHWISSHSNVLLCRIPWQIFSVILHLFPSILLHSPSISVHSLLFFYAILSPPVIPSHPIIPSHFVIPSHSIIPSHSVTLRHIPSFLSHPVIPSHSITSHHFCHIPSSVRSSIYICLFCLILSSFHIGIWLYRVLTSTFTLAPFLFQPQPLSFRLRCVPAFYCIPTFIVLWSVPFLLFRSVHILTSCSS